MRRAALFIAVASLIVLLSLLLASGRSSQVRHTPTPHAGSAGERTQASSDSRSPDAQDVRLSRAQALVQQLEALAIDQENGAANEDKLVAALIAVHRLMIESQDRSEIWSLLSKSADRKSLLLSMLVGSLCGGWPAPEARDILWNIASSERGALVAWAARMATMRRIDTELPALGDPAERLAELGKGRPPRGFNLKDYDFFWKLALEEIASTFPSMHFSSGLLQRLQQTRPQVNSGRLDRDTYFYSGAFDHELRDTSYRVRVMEVLKATSSPEDKEALFRVVSYKADGKPWADLTEYYASAARDTSLAPLVRYEIVSALAAEGSSARYSLFREVFLEEVGRDGPHLGIARKALVGLKRAGLASLGSDPGLEDAVAKFVRLTATNADYQDQLSGILGTIRPLLSPESQTKLLALASELEGSYPISSNQIRRALR